MVAKLEFTDYIDSIMLSAKHHEDTRILFYAIIRTIKGLLFRNTISCFATDFVLHCQKMLSREYFTLIFYILRKIRHYSCSVEENIGPEV